MSLEEKKVLLSRNPIRVLLKEWRNKEWWYTGAYDPVQGGFYVSWHFVRVNFSDQFTFTLFDPQNPEPLQFSKLMWLDRTSEPSRGLDLRHHRKDLTIQYRGTPTSGWRFELRAPEFAAEIDLRQTIPSFTKFDNE